MAYAAIAHKSTRCDPKEAPVSKMEAPHDSTHAVVPEPVAHDNGENALAAPGRPLHIDTNVAATESPLLTPLHLSPSEHDSSAGGSPGRGAVGTPSTVSTAPSTEDDASAEGMIKAGLEKFPLLWGDQSSQGAGILPRPRDPGIPSVIPSAMNPSSAPATSNGTAVVTRSPILSSSNAWQHNNHRRSKSWGEERSNQQSGPAYHRSSSAVNETEGHTPSVGPVSQGGAGMQMFHHPGVQQLRESQGGVPTNYYQASPTSSPPLSLPPTPSRVRTEHLWTASASTSPQSRVASFRTDPGSPGQQARYAYPPVPISDPWPREGHQRQQFPVHPGPASSGYHTPPYPPYKMGKHGSYTHSPPSMATPPRGRNPRQPGQNPHRQLASNPTSGVATPPRSSSEILKTLLRKKACLYEPETSRAVALVTWMVGRDLALERGYFSRQQLQSGVHACVASKIESGAITRTKVNRCMQIILNSCFHYIIPLPDGTEESAAAFRQTFARTARDDSHLVRNLGPPWDNLLVDRDAILQACTGDGSSPDASPPLESVRRGKGGGAAGEGEAAPKRTVLLCFNENVRSVEDVFRCHTEFIRDTANASKLQLSAQEWRVFFGKDALADPHGSLGVPAALTQPFDSLGQMNPGELSLFRTTWCAKRYDHDHELCGFAHVEVNGGWLRRNPLVHTYKDEMCPSISTILNDQWGPRCFVINSCPKGEDCPCAHSKEEIDYHPNRYKSHTCSALYSRGTPVLGRCPLGDVCPNLHPSDAAPRIPESRKPSPRGHRQQQQQQQQQSRGDRTNVVPEGAPMLYVDPAPLSKFEKRLGMPGLQSLFRRHCSVMNAHLHNPDRCKCFYSYFGDDWGMQFKAL